MPNRLYYTLKLNSSLLKSHNYSLSLTFQEALQSSLVISLADSQMLYSIRQLTHHHVDLTLLESYFSERDHIRSSHSNTAQRRKKLSQIQSKIYDMMYIPEYITVVMDSISDYKRIFTRGFTLNNVPYTRISCSASQARVCTVAFTPTSLAPALKSLLNADRDPTHPLAPSKFNAYFGLYSSSTRPVSPPRFCIVPDYTETVTTPVDYVIETDSFSDDIIEPRTIPIEFNRFDGSGIISPSLASQWARDLSLSYTPSQFCIRTAFTKGMVNVFDFHSWCHELNNDSYIITDIYNQQIDLRSIDLILSESQVKLWDSWPSQQAFTSSLTRNNIYWGVTKFAPEQDKDVLITNYQFLQTLNLSPSAISSLCQDTLTYLKGVSLTNPYYTLLFSLGTSTDIQEYLQNSDNYHMKSLILSHTLLHDKYTKEKIRSALEHQIDQAALGKLIVPGNFQCIVPDNYAYMQHITGQPVTGLLQPGEFYSQYWLDRNVTTIDCMRSPLTHFSEHYVVSIPSSPELSKWFKYSYSGIITNVHDCHTMYFAGSDQSF